MRNSPMPGEMFFLDDKQSGLQQIAIFIGTKSGGDQHRKALVTKNTGMFLNCRAAAAIGRLG